MQGTICNLLIKIIVSFVIEEFENRWENWKIIREWRIFLKEDTSSD